MNSNEPTEHPTVTTARDVREIRRVIPLEWYWRITAALVSIFTATVLFWLSHTYVSKEEYTADLKLAAAATERASNASSLRLGELSQENARGRAEITRELTARMTDVQDVLLKMKESLIRMEEKARVDEQQNARLASIEQHVAENRELVIRSQAASDAAINAAPTRRR